MDKRHTTYDKWFKDREGNRALGAPANLPLVTGVTSALVAFIPLQTVRELSVIIAFGTLFTWAWMELFDGVNYFRRTLGAVTLLGLILLVMLSDIVHV